MTNNGIWVEYNLTNKAALNELNRSLYNGKVKWSSNYKEKDNNIITNKSTAYVYYILKDDRYIDPRIMFIIDNNKVDLIRGRDIDEDIEYSYSDILSKKIKELRNIDQNEKSRVYDYIYDIESYNIINNKINNNEELDYNDIKRLYTSSINNRLSFNVGKKTERLKKKRNILEDYNKLTDINDKSKFLNYNYKLFPHDSVYEEDVLLKIVSNKPFILITAAKELKRDKEFVRKCALLNPDSFIYVSSDLKKHVTFVKELIKKQPSILKYTSKSIRSNKLLIMSFIRQNKDLAQYIDPELFSDLEFMKDLVKIDSSLSLYAKESLLNDKEIAYYYIANTRKFNWLSKKLRSDSKFLLKVIEIEPEVLLIIDESLKNESFYREAVKINPNSIFYIDDDLKDNDFLIEMVKANPYIAFNLYKNFDNNPGLLRKMVEVLSDFKNDEERLKTFKKETTEVLRLELEKFD